MSLCFVGSGELEIFKNKDKCHDLAFILQSSNAISSMSLLTGRAQCGGGTASGEQRGFCRICPPIDASLVPGLYLGKGTFLGGPSTSAKIRRRVTCNTTFLLSKDFLAPPHAGFVKLCSW